MTKLIPSYQLWCRRLTPGDAYLEAFQADNVALVDELITQITKTGVLTNSDKEQQDLDVLVLATGFRNNRVPPWTTSGPCSYPSLSTWSLYSESLSHS